MAEASLKPIGYSWVLIDMQNRTLGPYLAVKNSILISSNAKSRHRSMQHQPLAAPTHTETAALRVRRWRDLCNAVCRLAARPCLSVRLSVCPSVSPSVCLSVMPTHGPPMSAKGNGCAASAYSSPAAHPTLTAARQSGGTNSMSASQFAHRQTEAPNRIATQIMLASPEPLLGPAAPTRYTS
jgi:hypothetical protein